MIFKTKNILGIDVTISSRVYILEEIRKYVKKIKNQKSKIKSEEIKPFVIFTPNPEIITYAQNDNKFKKIVNTAQINLPDGAGLDWAIKKLFGLKIEKIAGIDFMLQLIDLAQKESFTVGLIGGRGKLAERTAECLRAQYKLLKIEVFEAPELEISKIKNSRLSGIHDAVVTHSLQTSSGQKSKISIRQPQDRHIKNQIEFTEKYFQNLAEKIIDKKIDILFVALGFPKQEYFINELRKSFVDLSRSTGINLIKMTDTSYSMNLSSSRIILMAVGGSFDYIAGRIPRAPLIIRNMGLEWLFRLIREPWRLLRQIIGAEFFIKILLAR